MNAWEKFLSVIKRGLTESGILNEDGNLANPVARVIAFSQLFGKIYDALQSLNIGARYMGSDGYVYIDWDKYLSLMDVYYDDDSALFALCTRSGKLFRLPVTVSGDDITLGDPVEIPLTGRSVPTSIRVFRGPDGKRRWLAVAGSSVLNRVGEIDSTKLFDSFIAYAERTGEYPVLCFYHKYGVIRFGVADFVARDQFLYLASGPFDDNDISQSAADGLERAEQGEWGNSIGYTPTTEPELMRVAGVNIPVYNEGVNHEISIVLEREAAAHFTSIRTGEVNRSMDKATRDKLAKLVGPELADQQAALDDETNRAITQSGMVARGSGSQLHEAAQTTEPPATTTPDAREHTHQNTAPLAATLGNSTIAQDTPATQSAPAEGQARAEDVPQSFEMPEELFGALVDAIVGSEAFQTIAQGFNTLNENYAALTPRLEQIENGQRTAQQALETRLSSLEQDDETRRQEWLADLPAPRTVLTLRPRESRAVELGADGKPAAPDSTVIANQTIDALKAKRAPQHA